MCVPLPALRAKKPSVDGRWLCSPESSLRLWLVALICPRAPCPRAWQYKEPRDVRIVVDLIIQEVRVSREGRGRA